MRSEFNSSTLRHIQVGLIFSSLLPTMADLGDEGSPPLFLDLSQAQRAKKTFLNTVSPTFLNEDPPILTGFRISSMIFFAFSHCSGVPLNWTLLSITTTWAPDSCFISCSLHPFIPMISPTLSMRMSIATSGCLALTLSARDLSYQFGSSLCGLKF